MRNQSLIDIYVLLSCFPVLLQNELNIRTLSVDIVHMLCFMSLYTPTPLSVRPLRFDSWARGCVFVCVCGGGGGGGGGGGV